MRLTHIFMLTVLCITIASCANTQQPPIQLPQTDPPNDMQITTETDKGCEVSVCSPKQSVAGDAIKVYIQVANKSGHSIYWLPTGGRVLQDINREVKQKGKEIPLTQFGETVTPGELRRFRTSVIKDGETFEVELNLSRLYDLTLSGDYDVSIEIPFYDKATPSRPTTKITVNFSLHVTEPPGVYPYQKPKN